MNDTYANATVTAAELMDEIALALPDFFEGEITATQDAVLLALPNGQRFRLAITAC